MTKDELRTWVDEWLVAEAEGTRDETWLAAHLSPAGRTRGSSAAEPAEPAAAAVPEPDPAAIAASLAFTYPAVKAGKVERPNGSAYVCRKIGGTRDVDVVRASREKGYPVLFYGPPGTGKTALVEAAFGTDLVTVLGSEDTEVSDFTGSYTQRPGGTWGWTDGALITAMENGWPLFIDEVGLVSTKVLSIVYSVMDGRNAITVTANPERGTVVAKPGFYIIAATNPDAPGVRLSEALLSRFAIHTVVTTDYTLARTLGVEDAMVTASENLDTRRKTGEVSWAPQLRELLAFRDLTATFGHKVSLPNLVSIAPAQDRDVVAEVVSRAFGKKIAELGLG